MIRKLINFLSAALIVAGITNDARAERPWVGWLPEDGVDIRQGHHVEWYRGGEGRYAGNNVGEVAFIWSDTRNGDRGVYVQVIDAQNNPKFEENGLKISDAPNRQEDPQIWPSSDGGWYIGWEDFDADTLGDIYATKIDNAGNRVRGWGDERGVGVCIWDGVQFDIRIVDDGQGGCIIAWIDQRGGDTADLYAQHILANGRIDPNWRAGGIPIVSAESAQNSHTADSDGEGGMIIGWRDGRIAQNFDIWAQRVSPAGQLMWGDGQGIRICADGSNQEAPKVCPDGAGGAFFAWVDDRNIEASGKDLFVQRVASDGQLLWAQNGEALVTEAYEQSEARIVNSAAGEAIVVWGDYREERGQTIDVYTMRISGANRLRKEWAPATGVPVAVAARNQQQARLYPDGQGGAYYVWEDEREHGFPQIDVWAQRMNRSGQPVWEVNGIPVCRAVDTQYTPLVRRTADGGMVTAWGDYRTGSQEIWAQTISPAGQIGHEENGFPLVEGIGGNATKPKGFVREDGSVTLFWLDGRFGGNGSVPFIQTFRYAAGEPLPRFANNGIPAMRGTQGGGINPDACKGSDGSTIVVWEDHRLGEIYAIYAQRIAANGDLLWGESGLKVADYFDEQSSPHVLSDEEGGAFVGWRAAGDAGDNNIFIQRLNSDGNKLWGNDGIALITTEADEQIEQMIADGEGGFVVTWLKSVLDPETFQWDDNIWANRVNPDGDGTWGENGDGIPIVDFRGRQRTSKIIKHRLGFMIVWVDGRDDFGDGEPGNDIYGQFIKPNGDLAWAANGWVLVNESEHQDNPDIAVNNRGNVFLVWEDLRNIRAANHIDLYINKFWPPQEPGERLEFMLGDPGQATYHGRRLVTAPFNQLNPTIIHDGQNGVYVAWSDFRTIGIHSDIYATHLRGNGDPYPMWRPNGNLISGAFHKQESVQLILFSPTGEAGAVALWEDKRSTGKEELSNVYVQHLKSDPVYVEDDGTPELPRDFSIETIAPNPFNPTAEMTFYLSVADEIRIGLYDVSGRLVHDYGRESMPAGRHKILLQGQNLAAGSYIVRLEASAGSVEHKVQLVK